MDRSRPMVIRRRPFESGEGRLHRQVIDGSRALGPGRPGRDLPAGPAALTQSPVQEALLLMLHGNGNFNRAIILYLFFNRERDAAAGFDLFFHGSH